MKCAIFCCLLVFCAFEIVRADLKKDLDNLYEQSAMSIGTFVTPKENQIQSLINVANTERKNTENCKNNFNASLNEIVSKTQNELQKCVNDGAKNKSFKNAQNCCTINLNSLKSVVQSLVNEARTCLNKL